MSPAFVALTLLVRIVRPRCWRWPIVIIGNHLGRCSRDVMFPIGLRFAFVGCSHAVNESPLLLARSSRYVMIFGEGASQNCADTASKRQPIDVADVAHAAYMEQLAKNHRPASKDACQSCFPVFQFAHSSFEKSPEVIQHPPESLQVMGENIQARTYFDSRYD